MNHSHYYYYLTYDDIVNIHNEIITQFASSNIHRGIQNLGTLKAIVDKPSSGQFGQDNFPDIYSKCAVLLETIIQWHPFVDGNKRTALAVVSSFMLKNKFILVMPFSAVRFSVEIAKCNRNSNDIIEWVKTHTAHNLQEYDTKMKQYVITPLEHVLSLYKRGENDIRKAATQEANKIIDNWLAVDVYPEYRMKETETIAFLQGLIRKTPPAPLFFFKNNNR